LTWGHNISEVRVIVGLALMNQIRENMDYTEKIPRKVGFPQSQDIRAI